MGSFTRAVVTYVPVGAEADFAVDDALGLVRKAAATEAGSKKRPSRGAKRSPAADVATGGDAQPSRALSVDDRQFGRYVILPPVDFSTLAILPQTSSILSQCIQAMVTNVDGYGWDLEYVGPPEEPPPPEEIPKPKPVAASVPPPSAPVPPMGDPKDPAHQAALATHQQALGEHQQVLDKHQQAQAQDDTAAKNQQAQDDYQQQVAAQEAAQRPPTSGPDSTVAVDEAKKIKTFFKTCNPRESFDAIRIRLRCDIETIGNGYLELIPDLQGNIVGLEHLPGHTVRITPLERRPILTDVVMIGEEGEVVERKVWQRFRRYVQIQDVRQVYFKEAGDPRPISARDGRVEPEPDDVPADATPGGRPLESRAQQTYREREQQRRARPRVYAAAKLDELVPSVYAAAKFDELVPSPPVPGLDPGPGGRGDIDTPEEWELASEIIHFGCVYNPISPYYLPRFFGAIAAVRGAYYSEQTSLQFFRRNAIPAMVVAVSGGSLNEASKRRIDDFFREEHSGLTNTQRVLVIEAVMSNAAIEAQRTNVVIDVKPMQNAQQIGPSGSLEYEKAAREKVASSFRLPGVFLGYGEGSNYATAQASRVTTEEQVFQPERNAFDEIINLRVLRPMGVKYWRFVTKGPEIADVATYTAAMQAFSAVGAMTPNQSIDLMNELMGTTLDLVQEPWGDYPFPMVLTALQQQRLKNVDDLVDAPQAPANPLAALMGGGGPKAGGSPLPGGMTNIPTQGGKDKLPGQPPGGQADVNAAAGLSAAKKMFEDFPEAREFLTAIVEMQLQLSQQVGQLGQQLQYVRRADVAAADLVPAGLRGPEQGKTMVRRRPKSARFSARRR